MPNATISMYFNDEEYVKYIKDKKKINSIVREQIKKVLNEEN